MKQTLMYKQVLVMYDIRDIQKYIFNTNKVRDIIGASKLVDNLLEKGINECHKRHPDISMEILFIGGGNACILYDSGKEAQIMNRELAMWVLRNTYSLQLATAVVEKTDRYDEDYDNLQREMAKVKMKMTKTSLLGALPVTVHEANTGLPVTSRINGVNGREYVSTEVALKRKQNNSEKNKEVKKFDEIVDKKGEDSTLAVVHIDGNNMGKRIKELMENEADYDTAVEKMKTISANINEGFKEAFAEMEEKAKQWSEVTEGESADKRYIRKIILAGDDITFVCTGKIALSLVETFVNALRNKVLFGEKDSIGNIEKNGFSVCAGIAYMHSHFPFSDAYRIAEMCCESAKQKAKQEESKVDGIIGNWVDYQICKDVQSVYLSESREKNYRLSDGEYLIRRPYYIPYVCEESSKLQQMNQINVAYSIKDLKDKISYLSRSGDKNGSGMMNSDIKEIRNTYPLGSQAMDALLTFLKSRDKVLNEKAFNEKGVACWYDATEIFELYEDMDVTKDCGKEEV